MWVQICQPKAGDIDIDLDVFDNFLKIIFLLGFRSVMKDPLSHGSFKQFLSFCKKNSFMGS